MTNKPVLESLRTWAGKDASQALREQRPKQLVWLASQENLIVAKFAKPLKQITLEMLAYNNARYEAEDSGSAINPFDPELDVAGFLATVKQPAKSDREAWVAVGRSVYCVSGKEPRSLAASNTSWLGVLTSADLVIKGSSCDTPTDIPVWEALQNYAGKSITDKKLGRWIVDYHQCRKIGKLVSQKTGVLGE